ncbi:hypothetical protein EJ06DRAFT_181485 [Trichodelitschia bisporula]|uniref:Arrestin C-terminal-like domain-containing protein n=1 Tax=Trichodelitschia bisporula TaxID=703511 RepID=A0A6G1HLS5_9PEZI|nr:hypothetical protein EJ06DRAFT_181485 [Trichodelitschia bisporula]
MAGVFSGGARTRFPKQFEIRLDTPFVVFTGEAAEAEPATLAGTLHLNCPDHMNVRAVRIRLEGKWKVSWPVEGGAAGAAVRDKGSVISEERLLYPTEGGSGATHKIAPGNHEWPFKFTLDPAMPESLEGLPGAYIVYDLHAEIDRGYMSKTLTATKHVRVIRTLGRDVSDTVPLPYSNEDVWRDKLWYHIYLPTRYYIYGTAITAELTLCPLHKGVTIGKIRMELVERVTLHTDRARQHQKDTVVLATEQDMPTGTTPLPPMTEESTGLPDESHHFRVTLPLERSLNRCRQSVESEHIRIYHNLKIYVNLHNPDGHVSQLLIRNLVHLFLSPSLPVDEMGQTAPLTLSHPHHPAHASTAPDVPPTYGRHTLDTLYDDIDPAAFLSGANTPFSAAALSRNPSYENLRGASLVGAVSDSLAPPALTLTAPHPNPHTLHARLASLPPGVTHSGPPTPPLDARISAPFAHDASRRGSAAGPSWAQTLSWAQPGSGAASNRSSFHYPAGAIAAVPGFLGGGVYDMEALARTPSYNTAVRSGDVGGAPGEGGLPLYEEVVEGRGVGVGGE